LSTDRFWLDSFVDWPAAAVTYGIGAKQNCAGVRPPKSTGGLPIIEKARAIASTVWIDQVVQLLALHPEATAVHVKKRWRVEGGFRPERNVGVIVLRGPELVVPEDRWPLAAQDDDWSVLSVEYNDPSEIVEFTVSRQAIDEFSIGGVRAAAPVAEIIFLQCLYNYEEPAACALVATGFDAERVAIGRRPRRWGVPGLKTLDAYLEAGGDPNGVDASGMTPLAVAIYLEQEGLVRRLVAAGADLAAPSAGLYPADVAVLSGDASMVRLCASLGAPMNTPGFVQPVFRAVDLDSPELLGALVECGARTDVETADGLSLEDYITMSREGSEQKFLSSVTAASVDRAIGGLSGAEAIERSSSRPTFTL
jgi:hypothetical protein